MCVYCWCYLQCIDCVVLVVEFESEQYEGSESSGFVEVVVIISGGLSTTPISVMITSIERTATGAEIQCTFNSNIK